MGQTATVLMNAVHRHCPEQIRFSPSDTLIGIPLGHFNRGLPWIVSVLLYNPDIVLMSAGAHIRSERDYRTMLETVYQQYVGKYGTISMMSDKLLIWKTINPGGVPAFGIVDEIPNLDNNG